MSEKPMSQEANKPITTTPKITGDQQVAHNHITHTTPTLQLQPCVEECGSGADLYCHRCEAYYCTVCARMVHKPKSLQNHASTFRSSANLQPIHSSTTPVSRQKTESHSITTSSTALPGPSIISSNPCCICFEQFPSTSGWKCLSSPPVEPHFVCRVCIGGLLKSAVEPTKLRNELGWIRCPVPECTSAVWTNKHVIQLIANCHDDTDSASIKLRQAGEAYLKGFQQLIRIMTSAGSDTDKSATSSSSTSTSSVVDLSVHRLADEHADLIARMEQLQLRERQLECQLDRQRQAESDRRRRKRHHRKQLKTAKKKKAAGESSSSTSSDDSSSGSDSSDPGSDSSSDSSDSDANDTHKRQKKKPTPIKKKLPVPRPSRTTAVPTAEESALAELRKAEGFDEMNMMVHPMEKYEIREIVPLQETAASGSQDANRPLSAPDDTRKWTTLDHNGVRFQPEYVPHKQPLIYDGQEMILPVEAEEVASMWAGLLDTAFVKNLTFAANFFRDFKAILPADSPITDLAKCDFTRMAKHIAAERENLTVDLKTDKRLRDHEKKERDELVNLYGYCLVDGLKVKVEQFRVEPPSLFRGRGEHPKMGRVKRRVQPEDIIINIAAGIPVPKPPVGHQWKGVIHNNNVTWIACYKDTVTGAFKYFWCTQAQTLKKQIDMIRKSYANEMKSEQAQFRQRGTAIYLIDFLALRVGDEKDATEIADTIGCCSLHVEHVTFQPPKTVTFDFLGKDSMCYHNTVELDQTAYDNLVSFTANKKPTELIFDHLNTALLNEHLNSLMPGLTAKVFGVYNASITLQNELRHPENDISPSEPQTTKVNFYNRAKREVALRCHHKRSIPQGPLGVVIARLRDQIESLQDEKEELEDWIANFKNESQHDPSAIGPGPVGRRVEAKRQERVEVRLAKAREEAKQKKLKEKAAARSKLFGKEVEPSEEEVEEDDGVKEKARSKPADLAQAEAALAKVKERLTIYEARLSLRDPNQVAAFGTSTMNYTDPRITLAWCKAKRVPLEAIFNKALLAKFPWAMEVPPDWTF